MLKKLNNTKTHMFSGTIEYFFATAIIGGSSEIINHKITGFLIKPKIFGVEVFI